MAISIDEIDDDLEFQDGNEEVTEVNDQESETVNDGTTEENEENQEGNEEQVVNKEDDDNKGSEENKDALVEYLKSIGIEDPSKIKFENDNQEIEEVDWKDLSLEEQLNILQNKDNQDYDENYGLDDAEVDLINRLRISNMTPQEYIAAIKQLGVAEYVASLGLPEKTYKIDDLTDEELYVLDLQARVGADNVTEEELQEALDRAKSNEELFAKEVAGLREEYKRLQDDKDQKDAALLQQEAQENYLNYANGVINAINNFNNIGELNIDLEDSDKDEIFSFLTGYDRAGVSYLQKALSDPETLVLMSWFALKGEDVINSISDYYKSEITKAHRAGYEEGLKKGSSQKPSQKESKVVVKKPETKEVKRLSIDDLD